MAKGLVMTSPGLALIGFGAIARDVASLLLDHAITQNLHVLRRGDQATQQDLPAPLNTLADASALLALRPALVIEAAGHEAVRQVVPLCLAQGLPVVISSVGALHDQALFDRLIDLARRHATKLILPSGAIGALDYVRAARLAGQVMITYESRKSPSAWIEELHGRGLTPDSLQHPLVLFEGSAREAAKRYPANLNVAATLAIAGCGFDETRVKVIVDPALQGNSHTITVTSDHGKMEICLGNAPSPANPKSSWIVGKSVVAAVQNFLSPCMML